MKEKLRKLLVPGLIAVSLLQSAVLLKNELDSQALNKSRYTEASEQNPTCLADRLGGVAYIILASDQESGVYRGVRGVLFAIMPLEISIRELNSRVDLIEVDCATGQPK
jgi:hypothetical protein